MFIEKICISGFKNYKESVIYDFNDSTEIVGRNAQGKTSIAEAITWGLYGCDLTGDTKADSKLKNKDSDTMYIIIDFFYNDKSNRIVRKKGKSLTLKLNDNRISEKELASFLPDRDLFLAVFNPKYFLSYSVAKQRSLLLKMLPKISFEDISTKYGLKDDNLKDIIEKFPNLNDAVAYYSSEIKKNKKIIDDKNTELSVYENLILENSHKITEVKPFSKEDEVLLNNLQSKLNNNKNSTETISTENLKIELLKLKNSLVVEQNKVYQSSENPFYQYIQDLNVSITEMDIKRNIILEEFNEMSNSGSTCPKCKQTISAEYKAAELNSLQEEMNRLDSQINTLKNSISILQSQADNSEKIFIEDKNKKINELKSQIKIYENNISEIEKANELMRQAYSDSNKDSELKRDIENLKQKQVAYINYTAQLNNQQSMQNKYKSTLEKIKKDILRFNEISTNLEIEQSKLKNYNSLYVQYIGEILTSWLNRVSINLFSVNNSTGEIKDTFDITFDKKPLKLVSNSEYTKAGLELSCMLNTSLNIKLPIFVDDAESIISIPKMDTQVIVARVKDCDLILNDLTVNDETVENCIEETQPNIFYNTSIFDNSSNQQLSFN